MIEGLEEVLKMKLPAANEYDKEGVLFWAMIPLMQRSSGPLYRDACVLGQVVRREGRRLLCSPHRLAAT